MADRTVKVQLIGEDKLSGPTKEAEASLGSFGSNIQSKVTSKLEDLGNRIPGVGGDIAKAAGGMVESMSPVGLALGGVGVAIAGLATEGVEKFLSLGASVKQFETVVGTTAEESSKWVDVLNQYGISAEQGSASVGKLAKTLGNNQDALAKYGVEVAKTADGHVDLEKTLFNVIDAYNASTDETKKAALASAAFGKSWQSLAPILSAGSEEIKAAFDSVPKGDILDQSNVDQAHQIELAWNSMKLAVQGLEITLAKDLAPAILEISQDLAGLAKAADAVLAPIGGLGDAAKIAFAGGFTAVHGLVDGVESLGSSIGDLFGGGGDNKPADQMAQYGGTIRSAGVDVDNANDSFTTAKQVQADYKAKVAESNKAIADQEKALQDATKALEAKTNAALADIDPTLAMDKAVQEVNKRLTDFETAQTDANKAIKDHGASSKEAAIQTSNLTDNSLQLRDAVLKVADAAGQAYDKQNMLNGVTGDAQGKIAAEEQALDDLKAKFPELGGAIDGYIATLKQIPTSINTIVTVTNANQAAPKGVAVATASGGFRSAGTLTLVGEDGPELRVEGTDATYLSAQATRSVLGGNGSSVVSGGGMTVNVTINAGMGTDGAAIGRVLVDELKKYDRANGGVPIRVKS
jgi:hypothetical protein